MVGKLITAMMLSMALAFHSVAQTGSSQDKSALISGDIELAGEIGRLFARDQYVRAYAAEAMKAATNDQERDQALAKVSVYIDRVDGENLTALKILIDQYGWSRIAGLPLDMMDRALTIVHHSDDIALKTDLDAKLPALYEAKQISGYTYAKLVDRLRVNTGKPQRFGTQTVCRDGARVFHEIEDRDSVDERRAALALPTLDAYMEQVNEGYWAC